MGRSDNVRSTGSEVLRVLLVEDSIPDYELVLRALTKGGLQVQEDRVDNEEDFVEHLHTSSYDIVLSDYNLKQWNGLEALATLKRVRSDIPFILITGTLGEEKAVEIMKSGAADYLLKSSLTRLPMAISKAVHERREHELLASVRLDKQRAEIELEKSEEKYRLLFEANPNPMWVYDLATLRFLAVNEAMCKRYGYTRGELLSMTIKDIRPAEELPRFMQEYEASDKGADIDSEVWTHSRRNGTYMDMEISSRAITFEGHQARLVLAQDITTRLLAEEGLRQSEAKNRSIIEEAPYGIYQVDDLGRLIFVNPAVVAMLGYESEAKVLKLNMATDVYWDGEERDREGKVLYSGDPGARHEAKWKRNDGAPIMVRLGGRRYRKGDEFIYEVFVENITEQKVLEQQYRQAQKMEAVGRLAGGVAHDFNNMLMVMNGYAELLQQRESLDSDACRYVEQIMEAGKRAAGVTRQLLAFSRQQVLDTRVLDLNQVLTELGKMLHRVLGEDIEMHVVATPSLGRVRADPVQIEQVIMNLVVNARDAMPKGGKLVLETANVELDEEYSRRHPVVKPGQYVMLAVSDTGTGIAKETQGRIFEPFFTTKEQGKGTGLGLATVYGIVKQSGGSIWLYSEPARGTTFKVYLPRVEEEADVEPRPVAAPAPRGTETILVVEDEAGLRAALCEYLKAQGYNVLEARHGAEALEISEARSEPIHLLLTDLVMPGIQGPELAARVSKTQPGVLPFYMSGYTDRAVDVNELGPNAIFLQKPFTLASLAEKLRAALGKK